jgi:hypothetical protein
MQRIVVVGLLGSLIGWCGFKAEVCGQTVHTVVVGDLSPAAGWGIYAPNVILDLTGMFSMIHANLPESQRTYQHLQIDEDAFSTPTTILDALDSIEARAEDTIFFYFSGHGAVDDQGHFLALAQGKLYRQTILERLTRKAARLVVVITDCCNSRSDGEVFAAPAPFYEEPQQPTPLFRSLFLEPRGLVDINSSSPGESAFFVAEKEPGFSASGSIFTVELGRWVDRQRLRPSTWDDLVRGVSLQVHHAFLASYPKGAQLAKGQAMQYQQTVYPITYPGMPVKSGPRTGFVVRDDQGQGAIITRVAADSPAGQVYEIQTKAFAALRPQQLIVSVNGKKIHGVASLLEALKLSPQIVRLGIVDPSSGKHEYLLRMRY